MVVAFFNCEMTGTQLSVFVNRVQLPPHIYLPGSSSHPKNSPLACSLLGQRAASAAGQVDGGEAEFHYSCEWLACWRVSDRE